MLNGKIKCVELIILLLSAVTKILVLGDMLDTNVVSNELFGTSIYDNQYFLPFRPHTKSKFSKLLVSYSKNNFSDKSTTQGLDITSPHIFQSKTLAQLYAVFPGTVWCGVGNLASNDQTLGYFAVTDSCCRTHDNCRLTIPSGAFKFGLTNTGFFTRSHCLCDEKFYYCLKKANSIVANKVGYTYFNLLRPQCFRKDFPIVACIRWNKRRCRTYVVDEADDREWQWFDNREY